MELFLDTASAEEIKRCQDLGLVDGVTTNPALLIAEGRTLSISCARSPPSSPGRSRPRSSRPTLEGSSAMRRRSRSWPTTSWSRPRPRSPGRSTQLGAASIRSPDGLIDATRANAHVITAPPIITAAPVGREKVSGQPIFELGERELPEDCPRT